METNPWNFLNLIFWSIEVRGICFQQFISKCAIVSVKTPIEQCEALGDVSEKELSNKNASLTYGAPTNTISTWVRNKENKKKKKKII